MKFRMSESQFQTIVSNGTIEVGQSLITEGQNEDKALSILKSLVSSIDPPEKWFEETFEYLRHHDKSDNHKLLPFMMIFALNTDKIDDIVKVFQRFNEIYKKRNINIELIRHEKNKHSVYDMKILGHTISGYDLESFESLVDHFDYLYNKKESEQDKEDDLQVDAIGANKIFSSKKFEIFHANSHKMCIELIGGNESPLQKKGADIVGAKYDFCIGWQENHYDGYRYTQQKTFYIIFDKDRTYKRNSNKNYTDPLVCVVIMVDPDGSIHGYDGKDSKDSIEEFGTPQAYLKYLTKNGVPSNLFKVTKPKEFDKIITQLKQNYERDDLFFSLTPKQKSEYLKVATNLTSEQMTFTLNFMPLQDVESFLNTAPDLNMKVYGLLNTNLKKKYINRLLINFAQIGTIDPRKFINYLDDKVLADYAIERIEKIFNDPRGFANPGKAQELLGLISPEHFFKSLNGLGEVHINSRNYMLSYLPDDFGEYIRGAKELYFDGLNINLIPESLGELKNLTKLHISNLPKLIALPESIGTLTNLLEIYCENINTPTLPASIINCKNLQVFSFNTCHLQTVPKNIDKLTNLEVFNVTNNNITELPTSIGNFKNLFLLSVNDNPLKTIPKSISKYKSAPMSIVVPDNLTGMLDKLLA
jgi:hypothetical protein